MQKVKRKNLMEYHSECESDINRIKKLEFWVSDDNKQKIKTQTKNKTKDKRREITVMIIKTFVIHFKISLKTEYKVMKFYSDRTSNLDCYGRKLTWNVVILTASVCASFSNFMLFRFLNI